jgi:hypothetical protein
LVMKSSVRLGWPQSRSCLSSTCRRDIEAPVMPASRPPAHHGLQRRSWPHHSLRIDPFVSFAFMLDRTTSSSPGTEPVRAKKIQAEGGSRGSNASAGSLMVSHPSRAGRPPTGVAYGPREVKCARSSHRFATARTPLTPAPPVPLGNGAQGRRCSAPVRGRGAPRSAGGRTFMLSQLHSSCEFTVACRIVTALVSRDKRYQTLGRRSSISRSTRTTLQSECTHSTVGVHALLYSRSTRTTLPSECTPQPPPATRAQALEPPRVALSAES